MKFIRDDQIWNEFMGDTRLSYGSKILLTYILREVDDSLSIEDTNAYLSERLCAEQPSTVSKWVNQLVKYNYITKQRFFDYNNRPKRRITLNPRFIFGPDWVPAKKESEKPKWTELF